MAKTTLTPIMQPEEMDTVSFGELERKIFAYGCGLMQEMARSMLEHYDLYLSKHRQKGRYTNKGMQESTVKTVFGEVRYRRRVYFDRYEGKHVYLLDQTMQLKQIGLLSENLMVKLVDAATEMSYRESAELISHTTGQTLTHGAAWNAIQALGRKIESDEQHAIAKMDTDQTDGQKTVPLLFMERDGVWLKMQDHDHKKISDREMKIATTYEGWKKEGKDRYHVVGKHMVAGIESARLFHARHEAKIRSIYDIYGITQRILSGDGASWIPDPYDDETIFQLDRFHVCQAITRSIHRKKDAIEIQRLFDEGKCDEMLDYIKVYADSLTDDKAKKDALDLYSYLSNNRDGLSPWQQKMDRIPEPPEGLVYRNMGIQESTNCTTHTMRMKHRRMRWSVSGATNMGKILCQKVTGELSDTISRHMSGEIMDYPLEPVVQGLSAAQIDDYSGVKGKTDGVSIAGMPLRDAARNYSRDAIIGLVYGL